MHPVYDFQTGEEKSLIDSLSELNQNSSYCTNTVTEHCFFLFPEGSKLLGLFLNALESNSAHLCIYMFYIFIEVFTSSQWE